MTIKELEIEANKLGYHIIKVRKRTNLLPCKCGCNRRSRWYKGKQVQLQCMKCGYTSKLGDDEIEARENWNKEMSNG